MTSEQPAGKTRRALWQDYLFLSQELVKFASPQEYDLFMELLSQREKLQALIEAAPDADGYGQSEAFLQLAAQVAGLNATVAARLQFFKNAAVRQRDVAAAYDGYGDGFAAGYRMDQSR